MESTYSFACAINLRLARPVFVGMERAGGIYHGHNNLSSLSLGDTGKVDEFLHIGLIIANPETFYPIGNRPFDPEGDDVTGRILIEVGKTPDLVGTREEAFFSLTWKEFEPSPTDLHCRFRDSTTNPLPPTVPIA